MCVVPAATSDRGGPPRIEHHKLACRQPHPGPPRSTDRRAAEGSIPPMPRSLHGAVLSNTCSRSTGRRESTSWSQSIASPTTTVPGTTLDTARGRASTETWRPRSQGNVRHFHHGCSQRPRRQAQGRVPSPAFLRAVSRRFQTRSTARPSRWRHDATRVSRPPPLGVAHGARHQARVHFDDDDLGCALGHSAV